jgi:hypothetical protein
MKDECRALEGHLKRDREGKFLVILNPYPHNQTPRAWKITAWCSLIKTRQHPKKKSI